MNNDNSEAPKPPLVTRQELLAHIAGIKAYRDQDPLGAGRTVESLLISEGLVTPAALAPPDRIPGALFRTLPDDLHSLTLLQVSLHDNWGQDTKPRGRQSKGKTGRPREKATRYAVTVQAWDQPEDEIDLMAKDWAYELIGDLYDAEGFRKRALDLQNIVYKNGQYFVDDKRRNKVTYKISDECRQHMREFVAMPDFVDPAYRFAILTRPKKHSGCPIAEFQFVTMKLVSGAVQEARLWTAGDVLDLPSFSSQQAKGGPFDARSHVALQARYARPGTISFNKWKT